ncbi:MAG TPA: aminoacyl-tRNA hydrolase, partial [Aestuariivirga sp.]|nr:aminoacyl-tRNA hydrolase [Aestuariivirga sp.]
MYLFVGLGNPGTRYAGNRHNIGFMAVDEIVRRHGFSGWRAKYRGALSEGHLAGEKVLVLKPQTYMNESGQAVGEALRFLNLDPSRLIVFYDELDLEPGKLRVKLGGGAAGPNRHPPISAPIGPHYARGRVGLGHPRDK